MFPREITSRLTAGLADAIPDLQERVDHILTKQVFGIAITHLTSLLARRSLYCSKWADGPHSVARSFGDPDGNIWFERIEHTWVGGTDKVLTADEDGNPIEKTRDGRCKYCGASQRNLDRDAGFETHAYAFIHTDDIKARVAELFGADMQFDVIIGNPPYQLDDGGFGTSAAPIYHRFVEQAKELGRPTRFRCRKASASIGLSAPGSRSVWRRPSRARRRRADLTISSSTRTVERGTSPEAPYQPAPSSSTSGRSLSLLRHRPGRRDTSGTRRRRSFRNEHVPHGVAVNPEGLGQVGDGDDDATAEADALEVAAADELVRGRSADAEDLGRLLDGEGEGLVGAHAHVGPSTGRNFAGDLESLQSTTLGGRHRQTGGRGRSTGSPTGHLLDLPFAAPDSVTIRTRSALDGGRRPQSGRGGLGRGKTSRTRRWR